MPYTTSFQFVDRLLPKVLLERGGEDLRKSRILGVFCVLLGVVCVAVTPYAYLIAPPPSPIFFLVAGSPLLYALNLLLLRWTSSHRQAAMLMVVELNFTITFISYHVGGLYSPALYWSAFVPSLAMFLLGRRWGVAALVLLLGEYVFLFLAAKPYSLALGLGIPSNARIHWMALLPPGLLAVFTTLLHGTFEMIRQRDVAALDASWKTQQELIRARDEARMSEERARFDKRVAQSANQAKSEFLATMSHELRTPLNAILGYSEMLKEDAEDVGADELVPDLTRIHSAGRQLLSLINDILDLSKIEAGKMELHFEKFEVDYFVQELQDMVLPLAEKNDNVLEIRQELTLKMLHSDRQRLRQSLLNLLSNACKFTQGGKVLLHVTNDEDEEHIIFTIEDTGIGISEEQLSRLFQSFSQADTSTTRRFGGTGLGLSISQKLCHMMGGSIEVESEKEVGSTFVVRLPVDFVPSRLAEPRPAQQTVAAESSPRLPAYQQTILVIDDDPNVQRLVSRILSKEGFHVLLCSGGAEGLRMCEEKLPDAIILDVMMPELDGWSTLRALKDSPKLARIPVLMLSIVDDKQRGYALGAAAYLNKPVEREILLQTVREFLLPRESAKLLIVDDDPGARKLLHTQLSKEGWEIYEAENGEEALRALDENNVDAILLDLMMPQMNGFAFLHELQKRPDQKEIPVIVLTAKDLSEEERALLQPRTEGIFEKPVVSDIQLLEQLHVLLATQDVSQGLLPVLEGAPPLQA